MNQTNPQKHNLIVGLGVTGLSVARHLLALGEQVAVTDSRKQPPGLVQLRDEHPNVAIFLGGFDAQVFSQADRLIVSPGVPLSTPEIQAAIQRGVPVLGDIELFVQAANAPIVAITGSNGKSTVTTLVGDMAKASGIRVGVGGNLGTPALDLLDDAVELYVLELSSFQLETTCSLSAEVATVLNISADHMDRYSSLQAYAAVKSAVLKSARLGLYNLDDARVMAMSGSDDARFFTLNEPRDARTFGIRQCNNAEWLAHGQRNLLPVNQLLMPGKHNQANALASLAIGAAIGCDESAMLAILRTFPGLPHRTRFVAGIDGVRWYNDSKATNVGATAAALLGMHQPDHANRAVVILGGICKDGDFTPLTEVLRKCARGVVLFGQDTPQIAPHVPSECQTSQANSLAEAIDQAAKMALPGDHVLLSPACASFDHFQNYRDRGNQFTRLVQQRTEKAAV